jgi:prepilin-type N-terminal cleavage/methylation domain-containing protein
MKKGFTLIELIVAIAIIIILTDILVIAAKKTFREEEDQLKMTDKEYCIKYYSDYRLENLPARCLKTFGVTSVVNQVD